jgi:hypothetical protein
MIDEKTVKRAIVAGVAGLLLLGLCYVRWGRPPQIGNKEALKVVEALFTAFSSRDKTRLAECEKQLHSLRDAGKLPPPAASRLDVLISVARGGNWRKAVHELFDLMKAQRRPAPSPVADHSEARRT